MVTVNSARFHGREDPEIRSAEAAKRIDGKRKAAVLILALEETAVSELLQSLSDEELEVLTAEIARLGVVEHDVLSSVLREFHDLSSIHGILKEGGIDQAIRLVERSFPQERSRRLVQILESQKPHVPLAFLSRAETDGLLELLDAEHPQTVAVVLAHMSPGKAAELLDRMDEAKRVDVVQRIATLQGTHDEVLEHLEKSLREHVGAATLQGPGQRGGVQAAADILKAAGRRSRGLLSVLKEEEPVLVDEIQRRLYTFEDIAELDETSLRRLCEEIDTTTMAMALKTAPPQLRERVLSVLVEADRELLEDAVESLGPVRVGDIEAARLEIAASLPLLEEGGEVFFPGRGAGEDRLVY